MDSAPLELHVYLFADLESSTRLWQMFPTQMGSALARHDAILREAIEQSGGRVVKTTGDGLMAVFTSAADAINASLDAQMRLRDEPWGETGPLRVRMGMHVGEGQPRGGDYYGPAVNRAARISAAAHGGQVLLSALAAELAEARLPAGATLRDLGEHRLKDLFRSERIYQLVHRELPGEFPPLATLSQHPNNLPAQTSELLGRDAQLDSIRRLLDSPTVRLLTLTGPGGIGKTRLALQAAADQIDRFDDGVYFVDLSPIREPDAVFEAIVRAVGLTGTADDKPVDILRQQLRDRQMLLVLDNFEQIIDAAGGVVDLLQICPQVKVLVTSREALRVRGEHLLPIPPLSFPDAGQPLSVDSAVAHEAIWLFVERAQEVRPDFSLTEDNVFTVVEICARLDGLPLAIELAASRLKLFSVEELRNRLSSRLELLRGGPRDLPARQRTLRDTIEWSYDLLEPEERTIFQLFSAFTPTRLQTIEDLPDRLDPIQDVDVVDRLTSLLDKSLVRTIGVNGHQQLSMLETIREFAAERLADEYDFASVVSRVHAEYFSDFARSQRERLVGSRREQALGDLLGELANLMKAWRYWVEAGDLEQLNRLLDGLWALYDARGWYHAAIELANDLLAVLPAIPESTERARQEIALRTSLARGLMALRGYTQEAEEIYFRALTLSEELGQLPQHFPVLRSVASFRLYRGDFDQAAAVGRQLLTLGEQQDDVEVLVDGHLVVGASLVFSGNVSSGMDHLERAVALFSPQPGAGRFRFGPSPGIVSYGVSAFLLWLTGHPARAVERASQAVAFARQIGHPYSLAFALFHAGFLDVWHRDPELALQRAKATAEIASEHDYSIWKGLSQALEGLALAGLGQHESGLAMIDQGVALYQGLKTPPIFWPLVLYLQASGYAIGGRTTEGLELIDQALSIVGEGFLHPEFALVKGDLLLTLPDIDGAMASFQGVLDIGERHGARMSQLRAATRLTRLHRESGVGPDLTRFLQQLCESIGDGVDCRDTLDARNVLAGTTVSPAAR
jgi:predicted ATPase/class 3 adenylate cyclase